MHKTYGSEPLLDIGTWPLLQPNNHVAFLPLASHTALARTFVPRYSLRSHDSDRSAIYGVCPRACSVYQPREPPAGPPAPLPFHHQGPQRSLTRGWLLEALLVDLRCKYWRRGTTSSTSHAQVHQGLRGPRRFCLREQPCAVA